jgi:deoxyribodipyrimidine photolyase-related protein
MNKTTGILVLGDQLSWQHPGLISADPAEVVVILAEVVEEATYVRHNRHKIALLFSAMRHFAVALRERGFQVEYYAFEEALPTLLAACERAQGADANVVSRPREGSRNPRRYPFPVFYRGV